MYVRLGVCFCLRLTTFDRVIDDGCAPTMMFFGRHSVRGRNAVNYLFLIYIPHVRILDQSNLAFQT